MGGTDLVVRRSVLLEEAPPPCPAAWALPPAQLRAEAAAVQDMAACPAPRSAACPAASPPTPEVVLVPLGVTPRLD